MPSDACNVLLTFAGRKGYQYLVLRSAPNAGTIVAADADPGAPILAHGALLELVPRIEDTDGYLSALEACVQRHRINCIIPLNDLDVAVLSAASPRFHALGTRYLGAPAEATRALCDKHAAAQWLTARGFATPPTKAYSGALADRASVGEGPWIVKPRFGQGSVGVRTIQRPEQFVGTPEDHVVQPFIEGTHFNLDVLRGNDGEVLAVVPKEKLEMRGGTAALTRSAARDDLVHLGIQIGREVNHLGMIDVDVIDAHGTLYVLEVNVRMGGCFPFACIVCPRLPEALLAVGRGEVVKPFLGEFRGGVTMFRESRYHEIPE